MDRDKALEAISTGHSIYAPEDAREVCRALGVPFDERLVKVFESDRSPKGLTMFHGPEDGVWSLALGAHVAKALGVADKARGFSGRGFQAQEYARVVRETLEAVKDGPHANAAR